MKYELQNMLYESPKDEILEGVDCIYILNYNYFDFKDYNQSYSDTANQF